MSRDNVPAAVLPASEAVREVLAGELAQWWARLSLAQRMSVYLAAPDERPAR